ncbi:MAG: alpha-ketoglutarate-dependent dioxygenase AlkB [Nannocystaceae bacterium]|nr:alpha-ketoglutarate-dependent dioxygenase AlkB [Nannocystaceae bacterium]
MTGSAQLIDRKAPRERLQLDDTSWVDVVRSFVSEPEPVFQHLHDTLPWTQGSSIREGRKVPDPRMGAGLSNEQLATVPTLHRARLVLEARYRIRLRGAAMVLYRDGRDSVGFHRDDEMLYLEKTVIAGLSLGAERPVSFMSQAHHQRHDVSLGAGDLYVMGGRCQADWLHAVEKVESAGPRISVVWRWTSRLGPPSSSLSRVVPDAPRKRRWR